MSSTASPRPIERVPNGTLAAYAGVCVPISGLGLPLALVVAPFYISVMQMPDWEVGLIFTLVRLLDLLVDPLLGYWMDGTRSRWGRRKPWVAVSVPLLLGGVFMLFLPPLSEPSNWVYLTGAAALAYIAYSIIAIAHMSWGGELSPEYNERSRIQGTREFAFIAGMLTVLILPTALERLVPGSLHAILMFSGQSAEALAALAPGQLTFAGTVATMGWFIMGLLPVVVAIALAYVPEPKVHETGHHEDWRVAWQVFFSNRALRRLLLADLFQGIAPGITAALFIFLIQFAFELRGLEFVLLLFYFVSGLVCVPLWIKLSYRLSKHRTLAIAMFYSAAALPIMLFMPKGNFAILAGAFVLYGVAYAAAGFLLRAIMADVADEDTAITGKERQGVYFSLLVMTNKLGYAFAPLIAYSLLNVLGFSAKPGHVNTPEAILNLQLVFVFVPMIFLFLTAYTMWNFPLDEKRQKELRAIIAARRAGTAPPVSAAEEAIGMEPLGFPDGRSDAEIARGSPSPKPAE